MTDVREKFMTGALDLVIRVGDTFGEVCCIDLANDPLVTFFFAVFAKKHQGWRTEQLIAIQQGALLGITGRHIKTH